MAHALSFLSAVVLFFALHLHTWLRVANEGEAARRVTLYKSETDVLSEEFRLETSPPSASILLALTGLLEMQAPFVRLCVCVCI